MVVQHCSLTNRDHRSAECTDLSLSLKWYAVRFRGFGRPTLSADFAVSTRRVESGDPITEIPERCEIHTCTYSNRARRQNESNVPTFAKDSDSRTKCACLIWTDPLYGEVSHGPNMGYTTPIFHTIGGILAIRPIPQDSTGPCTCMPEFYVYPRLFLIIRSTYRITPGSRGGHLRLWGLV